MEKITPNLWFDGDAEAAAEFYVSLFPDSRIDAVHRSAGDSPSTQKGEVLLVAFTLDGRTFPENGYELSVTRYIAAPPGKIC